MTNRKSQNSILFLTTLGVYLGLVLVGATPQVLAQAATAKQFSVKDEIEVKDDLDNKPDGCHLAAFGPKIRELEATYLWYNYRSVDEYGGLIEKLLDAYSDVGAFDVSWKSAGKARPWYAVTTRTNFVGADKPIHDFDDEVIMLGNGLPGKSFLFSAAKDDSGYSFRSESHAFYYDTPLIRHLYGAALDFNRCVSNTELEDVILRYTEIKVEGKNLIITTRLPRGSLDSLLATDAK